MMASVSRRGAGSWLLPLLNIRKTVDGALALERDSKGFAGLLATAAIAVLVGSHILLSRVRRRDDWDNRCKGPASTAIMWLCSEVGTCLSVGSCSEYGTCVT
jgi:hypothetical protein